MHQPPGEPWRPAEPWRPDDPPRSLEASPQAPPPDVRRFAQVLSTTTPWGTWGIIAICGAIYLLTGDSPFRLLRYGAQQNEMVRQGEWWRLFSAMFVHFGIVHLAVNMISLYNIGPMLERFYGNLTYLALYALSGLAGSAAMLWFGGHAMSGGASGAIFGLCGAVVVVGYQYRDEIPEQLRRAMTAGMLPVIGYNLLFGFIGNQVAKSGALTMRIGNAAHLGGLVAGVAFAFLVKSPKMRPSRAWRFIAPLMVALAAAPFVAEAGMFWSLRPGAPPITQRDARGFSFERPAGLLQLKTENGPAYIGDGWELHVLDETRDRPWPTVSSEAQLMSALSLPLKSPHVVTQGGHAWLVGDATTAGQERARVAVMTEATHAYQVILLGNPQPAADAAFDLALQTFTPTR